MRGRPARRVPGEGLARGVGMERRPIVACGHPLARRDLLVQGAQRADGACVERDVAARSRRLRFGHLHVVRPDDDARPPDRDARCMRSTSSQRRPAISPRRIPVVSARRYAQYSGSSFTWARNLCACSGVHVRRGAREMRGGSAASPTFRCSAPFPTASASDLRRIVWTLWMDDEASTFARSA